MPASFYKRPHGFVLGMEVPEADLGFAIKRRRTMAWCRGNGTFGCLAPATLCPPTRKICD